MCEYCTTEQERKPLVESDNQGTKTVIKLKENLLSVETDYTVIGSNLAVKSKSRTFLRFCPMCAGALKGTYVIGDTVMVFNSKDSGNVVGEPQMITGYDGGNVVLSNGETVKPKFLIKP